MRDVFQGHFEKAFSFVRFVMLEIESGTFCMLGECPTTELHS
jgi:hypothetical protein